MRPRGVLREVLLAALTIVALAMVVLPAQTGSPLACPEASVSASEAFVGGQRLCPPGHWPSPRSFQVADLEGGPHHQ